MATKILSFLFPISAYKAADKSTKLHFCIANQQQITEMMVWIDREPARAGFYKASFGKMKLLPQHVCCLVGDLITLQILVDQKKVDLTALDAKDWSCLHFAAVAGFDPIVQYLLTVVPQTLQTQKSLFGATYTDLTRLLSQDPVEKTSRVFWHYNEQGVVEGTVEKFQQICSVEYCDRMWISQETLLIQWFHIAPYRLENMDRMLMEYFLKQLPADPRLLHIKPYASGVDLCASTAIKPHVCIGVTLGNCAAVSGETNIFGIDVNTRSNVVCRVQHGFPNVTFFDLYHQEGMFKQSALFSIEEIPKGAVVCTELVPTRKRFGVYREKRREEMVRFFSETTPKDLLWKIVKSLKFKKKEKNTVEVELERQTKNAYLRYFYRNPGAVLFLWLQGIVDLKNIPLPSKDPTLYGFVAFANYPEFALDIDKFLTTLLTFETKAKALHEELVLYIKKFLLLLMDTTRVEYLGSFLEKMVEFHIDGEKSAANYNTQEWVKTACGVTGLEIQIREKSLPLLFSKVDQGPIWAEIQEQFKQLPILRRLRMFQEFRDQLKNKIPQIQYEAGLAAFKPE